MGMLSWFQFWEGARGPGRMKEWGMRSPTLLLLPPWPLCCCCNELPGESYFQRWHPGPHPWERQRPLPSSQASSWELRAAAWEGWEMVSVLTPPPPPVLNSSQPGQHSASNSLSWELAFALSPGLGSNFGLEKPVNGTIRVGQGEWKAESTHFGTVLPLPMHPYWKCMTLAGVSIGFHTLQVPAFFLVTA